MGALVTRKTNEVKKRIIDYVTQQQAAKASLVTVAATVANSSAIPMKRTRKTRSVCDGIHQVNLLRREPKKLLSPALFADISIITIPLAGQVTMTAE